MPEPTKPNITSQKLPGGSTESSKPAAANANVPKANEGGTVKSPTTGSTLNAASTETKKEGVITGDKSQTAKTESQIANTPTSKAVAEQKRVEESKSSEPVDKNITEFKGEILQGDSFMITFKRGPMTFQIPVPLQSKDDVVVMDNTFRIIDSILNTGNKKELEEKFASFIKG